MTGRKLRVLKERPAYRPKYPDLNTMEDGMTPTGLTSRVLVGLEEQAQKAVAENPEWLLARELSREGDSREALEKLGFKILGEYDDLFYRAQAPKGWEKHTEGYWTRIKDEQGRERVTQFHKGAIYDRRAHLSIEDIK